MAQTNMADLMIRADQDIMNRISQQIKEDLRKGKGKQKKNILTGEIQSARAEQD